MLNPGPRRLGSSGWPFVIVIVIVSSLASCGAGDPASSPADDATTIGAEGVRVDGAPVSDLSDVRSTAGGFYGDVTERLTEEQLANQLRAPADRVSVPADTIAYVRKDESGSVIRLIQADGSRDRELLSLASNPLAVAVHLAWRPDGTELAFASDFELSVWQLDIYAVTADGRNLRRLTNAPRPIAYPNYPQGTVKLTVRHPSLTGSVTVAYIEGSQRLYGWLASAVEMREVRFEVADLGERTPQTSVVASNGTCFFDQAANIDVVPDTETAIRQILPPSSVTSDFACPRALSPQWGSAGELYYALHEASKAETLYISEISIDRVEADAVAPRGGSKRVTRLVEDDPRRILRGSRKELLLLRVDLNPGSDEYLLIRQGFSPLLIDDDRLYVATLDDPDRLQAVNTCTGCDLIDAQWVRGGGGFFYSALAPNGRGGVVSQLRKLTIVDGAILDQVLIEDPANRFGFLSVSPDSKRLVVQRTRGIAVLDESSTEGTDLVVYDIASGQLSVLVENAAQPAWGPGQGPVARADPSPSAR